MSRLIQLNDPSAWDSLRPGQYVVFLSDARTDVVLNSEGKAVDHSTVIPVFETLTEAEVYAEQAVGRIPSVCAAIYDHQGRGSDPVRRIYHPDIRHRFDPERSARRSAWIGGAFLFAFGIWAIIAYDSNERFLWFYIVGLKLFTIGVILFVRGIGFFLGRFRK